MSNPAIAAVRRAAQTFSAGHDVAATFASDLARDVHDIAAKPGQAFAWMVRPTGTHVVFVGTPERCFQNMIWHRDDAAVACEPRPMSEYWNLPELADDMSELWFWTATDMAEEFVRCDDVTDLRDRFLAAYLWAANSWAHEHGTDQQIALTEDELGAHGWL